ncbi:MAG: MobA/MobL family protein [Flavobacteriaceae bacterium]|nr:MobA/MobL family protein [Flavobacteriaceae bacterium]
MALFSFRHSVKTFSPKCENATRAAKFGQTTAHLRYITRPAAARITLRKRLEHSSDNLLGQAIEAEAMQRRGRVCERFIIALPVEATPEQRVELARTFVEELTRGKAGYVLAIHDKAGNDLINPHFHLVAFDRHEKTGGRGRPRSVLRMAQKNAVEMWAKRWADIHNERMSEWGYGDESSISNLSFHDRGIDRIPEIHEGPASRAMLAQGIEPPKKKEWRPIDAGQTRAEANRIIREINQLNGEMSNDTGNRLGGTVRGNQKKSDGSRTPLRKDSQWSRPVPGGNENPKEIPLRSSQGATGDEQPPWLTRNRNKLLDSTQPSPSKANHKQSFIDAPERPRWPPDRRRRVRRVFLNLIILRNAVRDRLATLGGRRRPLPAHPMSGASIGAKRSSSYREGIGVER